MKSRPVWMMPVVALLLVASWGGVWADTSDVKGAAPVIVGKSGKHCKDDPHCFNRYHFAIKPAARVNPEQLLYSKRAMRSILTSPSIRRRRMWRPPISTSCIR